MTPKEQRIEFVKGAICVIQRKDTFISLISSSSSRAEAAEKITSEFNLTPAVAQAVLELRSYHFTFSELKKFDDELSELLT